MFLSLWLLFSGFPYRYIDIVPCILRRMKLNILNDFVYSDIFHVLSKHYGLSCDYITSVSSPLNSFTFWPVSSVIIPLSMLVLMAHSTHASFLNSAFPFICKTPWHFPYLWRYQADKLCPNTEQIRNTYIWNPQNYICQWAHIFFSHTDMQMHTHICILHSDALSVHTDW